MRPLSGPDDLLAVVADRFEAHPWAQLCCGPALEWLGGHDLGSAVAWRSGHPWSRVPVLHVLGPGADAAVAAVGRPGEGVIAPAGPTVPPPSRPVEHWALRLRRAAGPVRPGEERVAWLVGADEDVASLLEVANPQAVVAPGDPIGGRWCGVRDDAGRLIACACETVLAAPHAHLSSLAVHPGARRRGWAAAVTGWFTRTTLDEGAPAVLLGVDGENLAASRLYDRLGFDNWPMSSWDL